MAMRILLSPLLYRVVPVQAAYISLLRLPTRRGTTRASADSRPFLKKIVLFHSQPSKHTGVKVVISRKEVKLTIDPLAPGQFRDNKLERYPPTYISNLLYQHDLVPVQKIIRQLRKYRRRK
jgi:hypothetical protein